MDTKWVGLDCIQFEWKPNGFLLNHTYGFLGRYRDTRPCVVTIFNHFINLIILKLPLKSAGTSDSVIKLVSETMLSNRRVILLNNKLVCLLYTSPSPRDG